MLFKELKNGYPIHLLERSTMTYEEGRVMSVGLPHTDFKGAGFGRMLIDITVQTGDKKNTYEVSDSERTAYAGTTLIAADKESVVAEVRAAKTETESALAKIDEQRSLLDKASTLLEQLDTAYRDRTATENRFEKIENNMGEMKNTLAQILSKLNTTRI